MNTISIDMEAQRAAIGARIASRKHTNKECASLMPSRLGSGGGKMLLGLLVLAAVAAIGYSFFCLVDLVQNCELFGSEVARLIP